MRELKVIRAEAMAGDRLAMLAYADVLEERGGKWNGDYSYALRWMAKRGRFPFVFTSPYFVKKRSYFADWDVALGPHPEEPDKVNKAVYGAMLAGGETKKYASKSAAVWSAVKVLAKALRELKKEIEL